MKTSSQNSPSNLIGQDSFLGFDNYAAHPSNTCGQAVIAAAIRFCRIPILDEQEKLITSDSELLEYVVKTFGPNWPWRNGISNRTILLKAFISLGVPFIEHRKAIWSNPKEQYELLLRCLESSHPVIVLLDLHPLQLGPRYGLHWAVVYASSALGSSSPFVRLSSWGRSYDVPLARFMSGWNTWYLSYPYRYYMIELLHSPLQNL